MNELPVASLSVKAPNSGPRVTLNDIAEAIREEHYFTARDGVIGAHTEVRIDGSGHWDVVAHYNPPELALLTVCVLILKNGFTVVGHSAPVSAQNFDDVLGRAIAKEKAVDQLWMLLGYGLKDRLCQSQQFATSPRYSYSEDGKSVTLLNPEDMMRDQHD